MNLFKITSVILCCSFASCQNYTAQESEKNIDYREEMRNFVIEISERARNNNPDFIVIPQNGVELLLKDPDKPKSLALNYLEAVDALAQEDLFYGYPKMNKPTPKSANLYLRSFLDLAKDNDKKVFVIDYASSSRLIDKSYNLNIENNYTPFIAPRRELDIIPDYPVNNENKNNIDDILKAQNFLYLLNYAEYPSKQELLAELSFTNYDLLVLDLYFHGEALTREDIRLLKKKKNGGDRLVISYMSVGEAEDYRYYWKDEWNSDKPNWLVEENPNWEGNFKVAYWNEDWKAIIYGSDRAYLTKITQAGFDGVYLDIIDGYQYFEANQ